MNDIMFPNQSGRAAELIEEINKEEISKKDSIKEARKSQTLKRIVGAAVGVIALVWWCVLYPELCFPEDSYEVVYEAGEDDEMKAAADVEARDDYPSILQADDKQIVVKSKLLEWLAKRKD